MHIDFVQRVIDIVRGKNNSIIDFKTFFEINWKLRKLIKKIKKEKINLVFVCHRPNVWGSLKTVFEECNKDPNFNITIVAIPNKKQLPNLQFNHEVYETEGAEVFFKDFPCKVINGYNYNTKEWFDLKQLKPDYVFFQQPYNVTRTLTYKSQNVCKYAKILYVAYFSNFIGNGVVNRCYPIDFFNNVSILFSENAFDVKFVNEHLSNGKFKPKIFLTGFPRYDNLSQYQNINSNNWNCNKDRNIKRIIWTPRWCTDEGNCHFFDYKDKLLDYVENNKDIDFIFRPHPQAFKEWNATGELPEKEANIYKERYDKMSNAKIDKQKEYLTTFYSSDIMITDISSIVAEYFLTGKPIIYCHRKDCFNDFSRKVSEGFYWVHNWDELQKTIEMLKAGKDPLKRKRQEIIKNEFYIPEQGAGYTIKELIKEDFYE